MSDTTLMLGGAFPIVSFDKLPAGVGSSGRTTYEWDMLGPKQGIVVPGSKYNSAAQSARNFAENNPHDEQQERAIAAHLRGKIMAAKKAATAEGKEWTEDMEKAIQPDPKFVQKQSRAFATVAVTDADGKVIKANPKDKLAAQYQIIRIR